MRVNLAVSQTVINRKQHYWYGEVYKQWYISDWMPPLIVIMSYCYMISGTSRIMVALNL